MSKPPNIDSEEINKFNDIGKTWWNPNGPMKPLHRINPVRLQYINERHPLKNQRVLDVGCGGGILAEAMAREGAIVTGIDMSDKSLHAAREHAKQENINLNYQLTTVEQLAEHSPEPFDVITCLEMLEHVPDYSAVIATCQSLLKPTGSVFFSTISRNLKSYALAIVGAEYIMRILPRGTHEYAKFIRPSELNQAAEHCGLQLQDLIGMHYNPFSHQCKLAKDVSVNYITHYKHHVTKNP
jgi:2-polyprenyl-6-hydroxyphenyl methylase / 3-demethylubiquinone-9 3-methyltransferase